MTQVICSGKDDRDESIVTLTEELARDLEVPTVPPDHIGKLLLRAFASVACALHFVLQRLDETLLHVTGAAQKVRRASKW